MAEARFLRRKNGKYFNDTLIFEVVNISPATTGSVYWRFRGEGEEDWRLISKNLNDASFKLTVTLYDLTASKNPKARSIETLVITHEERYNKNFFVGNRKQNWNLQIPSFALPEVSNIEIEPIKKENYNGNHLIATKCDYKLTFTPILHFAASLEKYDIFTKLNSGREEHTFSLKNTVDSINTWPFVKLNTGGKLEVKAILTDNRGSESEPFVKTFDVFDYFEPQIKKFNVYRCDSNGNKLDSGTKIKAEIDISMSIIPDNMAEYRYYYRELGAKGWTYIKTVRGKEGRINEVLDAYFSTDKDYEVKLYVHDAFTAVEAFRRIYSEEVVIDFYRSGHGISFGRVATQDGFNVYMPVRIYDKNMKDVTEIDGELARALAKMGVE